MPPGLSPPVLHFAGPNPEIGLAGSPFYVNTEVRGWPVGVGGRRVAAVSAFGFSGTNAHVVVADGAGLGGGGPLRGGGGGGGGVAGPWRGVGGVWPVVVSAPTRGQLVEQVRRLAVWCAGRQAGQVRFADVSHTLAVGRRHHRGHRLACTAQHTTELAELLNRWLDGEQAPG